MITTQPSNATATVGNTATFTAAATGSPTPTVQWKVSTDGGVTFANDTTDPGNTTTTLSVTPTSSAQNGYEYEAVFTSSGLSTNTQAATLTVPYAPVVATQPANLSTNAGAVATFTATANGSPTPTVQWQYSSDGGTTWNDDTTDSSATTTTLSFTTTSC